ncbi:MAG: C10 family peptidase [Candidatus Zixiibacteriota bacterium]
MYESKFTSVLFRLSVLPLFFLVVFTFSPDVKGELATADEMQRVSQNWLTEIVNLKGSWAGVTNPEITVVYEIFSGDTLLARCYSVNPRGFVVVPVLKEMTPVKVYSDESNFDASQENGMMTLLRELLSSRLNYYASKYGGLDVAQPDNGLMVFAPEQRQLWDKYAVSVEAFAAKAGTENSLSVDDAGPLLTTSWHQGDPYNQLCPMGDGDRTVVGCVATAIAQILNFWQWPVNGVGSHTYLWAGDYSCDGSTPAEYLTADFTNPYDWANMADSCTEGCTAAEIAALSELNYEVGVACEMDYGACGSGSYVSSAMNCFSQFYKYSPELYLLFRPDYTLEEWYNIIKEEIDNGRPIDYFITRHSIVCDGYRYFSGQYQYHMNYGWGGSYTAWFVLDNLYCSWEPGDLCPSSSDNMIINLQPQNLPVVSLIGNTYVDNGGTPNGCPEAGESISMDVSIVNNGIDAVNTAAVLSTSDPYINITAPSVSFDALIPWGDSSTSQTSFGFDISSSCPDPHTAMLKINITADGGYMFMDSFYIFIGTTAGFTDDMESGSGLWSLKTITTSYYNEWHLETSRAYEGSISWKAGGPGTDDYSSNNDAGLVTPPFLLPNNAELSFRHWIAAEDNNDGEWAWDGGIVMISSGGGIWEQITPEGGYPFKVIDNQASPFAAETPCFSDTSDWSEAVFDLSAYSGVVQLMFRFGTDGYVTSEGWYIDNITVTSGGCCIGYTGDVNCTGGEVPDISDITRLIDYLYISHSALCCFEEADANGSGGPEPDISDITKLIDHLYISNDALPDCP